MRTTTYYGLKKPDGTDLVNIEDLNANMDIIAAQLVERETLIKNASAKTTLVDSDSIPVLDSGENSTTKKITFSNMKSVLKSYFDSFYNKYVHPTYTARSAGLYKVAIDSTGHVSAVIPVSKIDITALGIPAQDTIYIHPTNNGYKHIPAGGGTGLILQWSTDGTAEWTKNIALMPYSSSRTYGKDELVMYEGWIYRSKAVSNLNHAVSDTTWWSEYSTKPPIVLYDSGDECTAVTGGWEDVGWNGGNYIKKSTCLKKDDGVSFPFLVTNTAINLSGYSKVYVFCRRFDSRYKIQLRVQSDRVHSENFLANVNEAPGVNTNATIEINITSINQNAYFALCGDSPKHEIYKVWLE